jgi:hypothetical protein
MLRCMGSCAVSWGLVALTDIDEVAVEVCALRVILLGDGVLDVVRGSPHWGGARVRGTLGDGAWNRCVPGAGARLGSTLGDGAGDRRALGGGARLVFTLGDGALGRRIVGVGAPPGSTLGDGIGGGWTVGVATGCLRGFVCGGIVARGSEGV